MHFDATIFVTEEGTALALGAASDRRRNRFRAGAVRLVAQSQGTSAECADVDGDGTAGLFQLEIVFRHTVSGERIIVTIQPAGLRDIHQKGRYRADVLLEGPGGLETQLRGIIRLPKDLRSSLPGRR